MIVLRLGNSGGLVADWQRELQLLGYRVDVTQIFDGETRAATRAFQVAAGIDDDGEVGDETRREAHLRLAMKRPGPFSKAILAAAVSQLGVCESSTNRGPEIEKFWKSTSYPDGMQNREPWCAAFMCWAVAVAMAAESRHVPALDENSRPKSAAVSGWTPWGLSRSAIVRVLSPAVVTPRPGDVVIYTFSHIGVVESYDSRRNPCALVCIEGNSNDDGSREGTEVVRHPRKATQVKALIRFLELEDAA